MSTDRRTAELLEDIQRGRQAELELARLRERLRATQEDGELSALVVYQQKRGDVVVSGQETVTGRTGERKSWQYGNGFERGRFLSLTNHGPATLVLHQNQWDFELGPGMQIEFPAPTAIGSATIYKEESGR